MFTARELDLMQVEVEAQMGKLMEEFVKSFLGERMNDAQITDNLAADGRAYGEVHMETGRQPVRPGGEVRDDQFGNINS